MEVISRGRDLAELFANAARETVGAVVDLSAVQEGGIKDRLSADGADRGALLLAWLRQVLYLFNAQGEILVRHRILRLTDSSVEAEAWGELFDPGRHPVLRAAKTVRDAALSGGEGAWEARVTLDV